MSTVIVTPPTEEPVSVEEVKLYLRVDTTDDDELIESLIADARSFVETYTKRALVTRTLTSVVDVPMLTQAPLSGVIGKRETRDGFVVASQWQAVELPYPPLTAVSLVERFNLEYHTWDTVDSDYYVVDSSSVPGIVIPTEAWEAKRLRITYTAGYGDANDVPSEFKSVIKSHVGHFYANREGQELPKGISQRLDQYRIYYV